LGVHFLKEEDSVLVADTYNHKMKLILSNNEIETIHGGKYGLRDGPEGSFSEPTGIASKCEKGIVTLFIADSNNDCIRVIKDG